MTQWRRPRPGRRDDGAVFVESLVATAIVSMVLVATFQVIADGAAREHKTQNQRMAVLVAQSELAAVGADIPLESGDSAGYAGNLVWRAEISPYDGGGGANSVGALMKVRMSVRPRAGGANLVVLDSLRLASAS
jgi:hypothetical protein